MKKENLKETVKIMLELTKFIYDILAEHPVVTTISCGFILGLHVALNLVFLNQEMPVTHIVLAPWIAALNVFNIGCITGSVVGYTALKQFKKN